MNDRQLDLFGSSIAPSGDMQPFQPDKACTMFSWMQQDERSNSSLAIERAAALRQDYHALIWKRMFPESDSWNAWSVQSDGAREMMQRDVTLIVAAYLTIRSRSPSAPHSLEQELILLRNDLLSPALDILDRLLASRDSRESAEQ